MPSQIDPTVPVSGTPTTASVRANFQTAADEISALQNAMSNLSPFAALWVSSAGTTIIPADTGRVYVTIDALVTLVLPPNDCLVLDRSGTRVNPITVTVTAPGTINGLSNYNMVTAWQVEQFFYDGTGNYAIG